MGVILRIRREYVRILGSQEGYRRLRSLGRQPIRALEPHGTAVVSPVTHLASEHAGHMPAMAVHDGSTGAAGTQEPPEVQARAVSAGPKHVTDGARITGTDAEGKTIVVRECDNEFVCLDRQS